MLTQRTRIKDEVEAAVALAPARLTSQDAGQLASRLADGVEQELGGLKDWQRQEIRSFFFSKLWFDDSWAGVLRKAVA